jgi:hypothetical protein
MNDKSSYNALLDEICGDLGFCGSVVDGQPLHVDHFIPEQGIVSADEFVDWVFRAEGWSSSDGAASSHAAILRKAFVRHMGAEAVDAEQLK